MCKLIKPIKKRHLKKWLQGKVYMYPFAGILLLLYMLAVIPFAATLAMLFMSWQSLWEFKDDAIEAVLQSVALILCKVEDDEN